MAPLTRLALAALAASLVIAGCGGDNDDTSTDTGVATDTDNTTDDSSTTDVEEDTGPSYAYGDHLFFQCETNDDCDDAGGQSQECVNNVCVIPPFDVACLAEETIEDELVVPYCLDVDPEVLRPERTCFDPESDDYIYRAADGPETATLSGFVDRFGSGSATYGLCLGVYNEDLLLPYMTQLECQSFDENDDDEEELFIACYQLDTCRCEDFFAGATDNQIFIDAAAEAWGEDIDDLNACYTFLGYCDGIEDADDRAACVARVEAMTFDVMDPALSEGITHRETIVFGHTRSYQDPEIIDEEADAGRYDIEGMPTNTMLAFKVSGLERRWRDAWEYGLFVRADRLNSEGGYTLDANAIGDGGWRTIPPAVGLAGSVPDTHGAIAGSVRDCGTADRDPFNIVHATVGMAFDARVLAYFNGNPSDNLPMPGRVDTNLLATYAGIDMPPGPNRISPIILTEEGPISAGGRNVFQTPKSLIIATFEGHFRQE